MCLQLKADEESAPSAPPTGRGRLNKEGRDEWESLLNADAVSFVLTTIACDRRRAVIFQSPESQVSGTHVARRQCGGSSDVHAVLMKPQGGQRGSAYCLLKVKFTASDCLWELLRKINRKDKVDVAKGGETGGADGRCVPSSPLMESCLTL